MWYKYLVVKKRYWKNLPQIYLVNIDRTLNLSNGGRVSLNLQYFQIFYAYFDSVIIAKQYAKSALKKYL